MQLKPDQTFATMSNVPGDCIVTPHDHDVLSGRGNFVNYHPGNEHFRALVRKHKVAYVACPKPQKGKFSKLIVDEIKSLNPPGRFLKQDPKTKLWTDIGEKKSLDKTRQALREGAPEIIKELNADDDSLEGEPQLHEENVQTSPDTMKAKSGVTSDHILPQAAISSGSPQGRSQSFQGGLGGSSHYVSPTGGISSSVHNSGAVGSLGSSLHSNARIALSSSHHSGHMGLSSSMHNNGHGGLSASMHATGSTPSPLPQPRSLGSASHHVQLGSGSHHLPQHSNMSTVGMMPLPPPPHTLASQQPPQHPYSIPAQSMMDQQRQQLHKMQQQMPLHGSMQPMQGNSFGGGYISSDSSLQSKLTNINNQAPYSWTADAFDPRPIAPSLHAHSPIKVDAFDAESVGPLPPRKSSMKLPRRGDLKREGSEGSLQVDALYSVAKQQELAAVTNSTARNHNSSAHLSVMSLSIGDMGLGAEFAQQQETTDKMNTESLARRLDNSLRLGRPRGALRRSGSGDGSRFGDPGHGSDLGHVMDMSVATLGDKMSDFGDMSMAKMTESQANMSFSNVFEETDKDIYVNRR